MKKYNMFVIKSLLLLMVISSVYGQSQDSAYQKASKLYKEGNFSESIKYWEIAAKDNNPEALYFLGLMYHVGRGVKQDYKKAAMFYKRGLLKGNIYCANNLAILYNNGLGVKKDMKKALEFYLIAAKKGGLNAQCNVAAMYRVGQGTKRNPQEAVKWFTKAANKGFAKGQFWLGYMFKYDDCAL